MKHAIVINLDYENNDRAICCEVWEELEQKMHEAGFSKHKRLFVSSLDWETTCKQAKTVVADIEKELAAKNIIVFDILKEFYCFEFSQMNDLLDPSHHAPDVSFVDTVTFMAFVSKNSNKPKG
jgi:hypothetical protein